jgi:putative ABC transport system substrate-binding protein
LGGSGQTTIAGQWLLPAIAVVSSAAVNWSSGDERPYTARLILGRKRIMGRHSSRSWLVERRAFIGALVTGAMASVPGVASAQQAKPRRIGILSAGVLPRAIPPAFLDELRKRGWVEGQNLIIERRSGDGYADRVPVLASELVGMNLDVILTFGAVAGVAMKNATTTIPIVATTGDPVRLGLVSNLSHPEGNITGLSQIAPELAAKRLELIHELLPKAMLVGELVDPANAYWQRARSDYEEAFRAMRMHPLFVEVHNPSEIEGAIAQIGSRRADALVVRGDPMFTSNREQIARLAVQYALPTMAEEQRFVEAGILMSYGPSPSAMERIVVSYVDKILRGAKPGELPIAQPTKFDLVINLKTAKALGLTIPKQLLLRVDEVIE